MALPVARSRILLIIFVCAFPRPLLCLFPSMYTLVLTDLCSIPTSARRFVLGPSGSLTASPAAPSLTLGQTGQASSLLLSALVRPRKLRIMGTSGFSRLLFDASKIPKTAYCPRGGPEEKVWPHYRQSLRNGQHALQARPKKRLKMIQTTRTAGTARRLRMNSRFTSVQRRPSDLLEIAHRGGRVLKGFPRNARGLFTARLTD